MVERWYNQDITYWAPTGESLYGAQNTFAAPITTKGRWEDKQQQAISPSGEEFVTKAVVYLPIAVSLGGFLALGTFNNGSPDITAQEIRGLITIPDLRNVTTERRALL